MGRGARGGVAPLNRARIAAQNICEGAAILEGEAPGLTEGVRDREDEGRVTGNALDTGERDMALRAQRDHGRVRRGLGIRRVVHRNWKPGVCWRSGKGPPAVRPQR